MFILRVIISNLALVVPLSFGIEAYRFPCNCFGDVIACDNLRLNNYANLLVPQECSNNLTSSYSVLNLSHNEIHSFSRYHIKPYIRYLDLSHNKIQQLDTRIKTNGFVSLKVLNLSFNYISHVPEEAFHGLTFLTSLDLSHNNITSIHNESLSGVLWLETLNLSCNKIAVFEANIPIVLRYLDLSSNLVFAIRTNIQQLQTFDVRCNIFLFISVNEFNAAGEIFSGGNHLDCYRKNCGCSCTSVSLCSGSYDTYVCKDIDKGE